MTNPNVELVRAFFDALARGDVPDDLIHPDLLITNTSGFLVQDEYRGPEGFRRWRDDLMGDLDATSYTLEGIAETDGDALLIKSKVTGRARTAEMDVDLVWWAAAKFRDGKIARLAGATSRSNALELAGEI